MRKFIKKVVCTALILLSCLNFSGCLNNFTGPTKTISTAERLSVHYIDIGQGDSELVIFPDNQIMLIDTGIRENADTLIRYLESQNIKQIDYMVLTHPHEDHIGGAYKVINEFEVKNICMSKIPSKILPTTKTYENLLKIISNKNINVIQSEPNLFLKNTENTKVQILGPLNKNYDNLNNYSVVIKLIYNEKTFLFTGDAEKEAEKDIIKFADVKADVLKCGHHGSRSSSSTEFLAKVAPKYAIISCGKGNTYGHPHKVTLNKLEKNNIKIYRTDIHGTIIISVEGQNLNIVTEKQ